MKQEDNWADKLRKRLEDYSEPLPPDLWKDIEKDIRPVKVIPIWKRIASIAAVVAALVLSSISAFFWFSDTSDYVAEQNEINRDLVNKVYDNADPENTVVLPSEDRNEPVLAEGKVLQKKLTADSGKMKMMGREKEVAKEAQKDLETNVVSSSVDFTENISVNDSVGSEEKSEWAEKRTTKSRLESDRRVMARNHKLAQAVRPRKMGKWSVGMAAGNVPYTSTNSFSGMHGLSRHVVAKYTDVQFTSLHTVANPQMMNSVKTNVKHRLPVSTGLVVKYSFSDNWGIETGLMYTLLSSEWQSAEHLNVDIKQKLHYLGVPLKLDRTLWSSKLFTLYVSAGGMMEKCIDTKITSHNKDNAVSRSESPKLKELQWSILASLGAQFNINRYLGLFLEPGAIYYFDDGSSFDTIRKETPFNFSLKLGLRLTFTR